MKQILVLSFLISLLCVTQGFAQETFTLETPISVAEEATGGKIVSYEIVPRSSPTFTIKWVWIDASGNITGRSRAVTWSGQDFTDLFGGGLGTTLRDRIHQKIEAKYGVEIQ